MNLNEWNGMSEESQEWLFRANKHTQDCPICKEGLDPVQHGIEARDYWEKVLQEKLDKGKEYYERNYLGLPDYIIDAFKEE